MYYEETFTLWLNGKVVRNDFASRDKANKYSDSLADALYREPANRRKFPWGFAFRISKNEGVKK